MATGRIDAGVLNVIELMGTIVGSEGGSLELVEMSDDRLTVRYIEGVNEECPECVPTHEMVRQMMTASLKVHAPQVSGLELL
jgi:hypothetical protein